MIKSKVSHHLSALKMGKFERRFISVKMKAYRTAYNRAVRRDKRNVIREALKSST